MKAHAKPHYHSEVIQKLADLPQPVISAVQGHCSTGALELALAADLIVASESAQFSDVYARWGLTPVWGLSLRLPHRVGTAKASEMMFTCRTYSGREAQAMHLANFCFAGRSLRGGAECAVRRHPGQLLVCQPGEQARADRERRSEPERRPRARAVQERGPGAGCRQTHREILRQALSGRRNASTPANFLHNFCSAPAASVRYAPTELRAPVKTCSRAQQI